jgi:hypothetical protein
MCLVHLLAEHCRLTELQWLSSYVLDVPFGTLVDFDDSSALHHCCGGLAQRHLGGVTSEQVAETAEFLVKVLKVDVNHQNSSGATAAHSAADTAVTGEDALTVLKCLKTLDADLSLCTSSCKQDVAMALAQMHGPGPWLDWCLSEGGCDPKACSAEHKTALQYAAEFLEDSSDSEDSSEGSSEDSEYTSESDSSMSMIEEEEEGSD